MAQTEDIEQSLNSSVAANATTTLTPSSLHISVCAVFISRSLQH
ncbi:hypothetical protein [Scytonema hofmannii]|nr:hypothetical protein [Scytonema hofmannii]